MQILKILSIFLFTLFSETKRTRSPTQDFKFLNCKCLISPWFLEPYLYKNWTCYAKNWSRNMSTINADFTLIKPVNKILVSFNCLCNKFCINFTIFTARNSYFLQIWNNLPPSSEISGL